MIEQIKKYIISHKIEIALLLVILLVAAFLRLYKIDAYMTFLGDEGRDAIVAKDILRGNLTLLGPRASAGDFFLGPIYYYMMAPFLLLSNYDPVGPAIMVALFGIATVFLVYYVGLKFFNARTGLIASSIYAISPLVIAYSRSSWNPNLMPFFSLLLLYLLYVAVKKQSIKYFLIVGILLGITMQLHYLTTFLAVIIFVFILLGNYIETKKIILKKYATSYLSVFSGFIIGFSPFLLFEIRHSFPNISTILRFVLEDNASKGYSLHQSFLGNITGVSYRLFARLVTNFPPPEQVSVSEHLNLQLWQGATIVLALISVLFLFRTKDKLKILLISLWLFFGIFLFGIYRKPIYDYYLGFMFPLPFFLVGNFLSSLLSFKKKVVFWTISLSLLIGIVAINLNGSPFKYPANGQKEQARTIANFVLEKAGPGPFNFALLTRGNSDHVYRYFFEIANRAPVVIENPDIDPERKTVTNTLMVVCEYQECQPLGNPLWEVAGFGRAQIEGVWTISFVKVFKLTQYKELVAQDIKPYNPTR